MLVTSRQTGLVAGVLAVGLLATAGGWYFAREAAHQVALKGFEKAAADVAFRLRHGFLNYQSVPLAGAALFSIGQPIGRESWHAFVASTDMEHRYPGMVALGYARVVKTSEVHALEQAERRAGRPEYKVWPVSTHETQVPVIVSEPMARNGRAAGFDMNSESIRRSAIERARDRGLPALTGKLTLVFDETDEPRPGFIVYVPYYQSGAPHDTVVNRRSAIAGFVYAGFRMQQSLPEFAGELPRGVDLAIYDGRAQHGAADLMFDSSAGRSAQEQAHQPAYRVEQTIDLGGHEWTLHFSSRLEFERAADSWLPLVVLASGCALSIMLAGLVLVIGRTRDQALAIAQEMTVELRDTSAELQAIYDSSPLGVWRADRDGHMVHGNPRSSRLLGMSGGMGVGDGWIARVHPEDREEVRKRWARAVTEVVPYECTFRYQHYDGRWIWLSAKSAPLLRGGVPHGHVGTIEDVTELQEAAAAIERERLLLDRVLEGIPNAVVLKDERHRWLHMNAAFAKIVGATREDLAGKDDRFHLDPPAAAQRFLEDDLVIRTGEPLVTEQVERLPDGTLRTMLKSKHRVQLLDGSWGVVATLTDITELKRAEADTKAAREMLDAVMDAVPAPISAKDSQGRFLLVNQALCELHGIPRDWLIGKDDTALYSALDARRIRDEDARVAAGESVVSFDAKQIVTYSGAERWVLRRKRGFMLPGGGRGVVVAMYDITEMRRAEQELERAHGFLNAVIDAVPQALVVKDRMGRFVIANQTMCRMFGRSKEELIGYSDDDLLLPEFRLQVRELDERTFASQAPITIEHQGRSQATLGRWFLRNQVTIPVAGAQYIACISTDITELKQAQSSAERSRAFLDALINAIPHPVFVKDREHRFVLVNDAMCAMFGRSREWMLGRTDADHFDPALTRTLWAEDDEVFTTRRSLLAEIQMPHARGDKVWMLKSKSLIGLPDGREYIVGISTNISERHAAEEKAERNRQFLNLVLEAMPQGVFVKDESSRWLMVNQVTARMLGVPREQLEGRLPHEALPHDFADAVIEQDRQTLAHDGALTFEQRPREVDGRKLWLMKTTSAVRLPDGTRYLVGVNTDVSELKETTAQLQRARELLDAVVQSVPAVVSVKDAQHRIVFINHAAETLLGHPSGYFLGKTDFELYSPEQARRLRDQDLAARGSDEVVTIEEELIDMGGERRWLVQRKRGVTLPDGQRGVLTALYDITELKRTEQALRESESKLRLALLASRVGLWTIHGRDWSLDLSASWYEQLGLDPLRDVVRKFEDWTARLHPDDSAAMIAEARAYLQSSRVDLEMEYRLLCGDGQYRTFLARGVIEREPSGRMTRIAGAQIDITQIKQIEAELLRHRDNLQDLVVERTREVVLAKEAAEAASRAKSEFLANMSHELRTPMHAILSFARLGLEKVGDDPALAKLRKYFARVEQSGERLLLLLNDLLDLSKLEVGKMRYEMAWADLRAIVAGVVDECAALARDRELRIEVRPRTDNPRVWCDAHRMTQVVRNLLSNAIRFSPTGGRVWIDIDEAPAGTILLTVRDEGVGIPVAELEMIFEKFVQSSITKTSAGGTGLGLAICRQIVEAHGGTIQAGNNAQVGAFFTVALPRTSARSDAPQGERQQRKVA